MYRLLYIYPKLRSLRQQYVRKAVLLIGLCLALMCLVACGSNASATNGTGLNSDATPTKSVGTPTTTTKGATTATTTQVSQNWNSIAIAASQPGQGKLFSLLNYNYANGQHGTFANTTVADPQFDGIAPDGQDLLYQATTSEHVQYYLARKPFPNTGFFYQLTQDDGGNAIWERDARHVLILARNQGVLEVDTQTGRSAVVLRFPLYSKGTIPEDIGQLVYSRASSIAQHPYLFFVGAGGGACMGKLCRVMLNQSDPQVVVFGPRQTVTTYWFSPDQSSIYYLNTGPAGELGILQMSQDGKQGKNLGNRGIPIGFAEDNALIVIRQEAKIFSVYKLGATPQADKLLLADVAPGAASLLLSGDTGTGAYGDRISVNNIALAPYGHALVVVASQPGGAIKVWSDDLATGKRLALSVPYNAQAARPVQLLGWDRLAA